MDGPAILLLLTLHTGPGQRDLRIELPMTTPEECAEQLASFISRVPSPDKPEVLDATCKIRLGPSQ